MVAADAECGTRLTWLSGLAVIALHVVYFAVTFAGFLSLGGADEPISDPWFGTMEVLIILMGPPVLVFLSSLFRIAAVDRPWLLAALVLAAMTFALSVALHAVVLAIGRGHAMVGAGGMLRFAWPSAAYAIDILAWDWFFAFALICCAMALRRAPGMAGAGLTSLAAGLVALFGLVGPISGAMALRDSGILGYAVLFPVAVALVLRNLPSNRLAQKS